MAVDQLTETFAALADPTRRAILTRLADGEATVNELAEPFPITVQAVSKHLKVLERAGLITRGRSAQLRPSRLHGARLVQTMLEHDLVDELRLMVYPMVLGSGKRLFGETSGKKPLRLVDSKVVGDGVAILIYQSGS